MPDPMNTSSSSTSSVWRKLIGHPSEFTLEARIFHSISLGTVLLLTLYVPYNLYAGLHIAALSCVIFGGIFFYEYYRSRYLSRAYRSLLFGLAGLVLLSFNYFANAGIQGSTDLIWPVYLLFVLTICPYRHLVVWLIVYLVVFGLIHVAEYLYPHLVQYPFSAGNGQFTDRITAFPLPVISIALIIGLFRRNYDKERATVAQRDNEKSRLLSILSHDLRAPFVQVQQYLDLLNEDVLSPEERVSIEKTLKQNNEQTLHLVTNLLYWSRSQLDGTTVTLTSLNVSSTIKNTLAIAASLSAEKGITLSTQIDPAIDVTADADMLQLVIRNLLQNAIKFTQPGGVIEANTGIINGYCHISIGDNGKGIAPDRMDKLFSGITPSFGTANEKGVGLGLQLCKDFMERQGGSIQVDSEEGKGSQFTIVLPLVTQN